MIEVEDRPGVLREISALIEKKNINISAVNFTSKGLGKSLGILVLETPDLQSAREIIGDIRELESVEEVRDTSIN